MCSVHMNSIQTVESDAKLDDITNILQRDGVVIIKELIKKTDIQEIMGILEPIFAEQKIGGGDFYGNAKKSITALFSRGPEFAQLPLNPVILGVAEKILGSNCDSFQIQTAGAMEVWGGGTDQPLHRDADVYLPYLKMDPDGPEYEILCMFAGSDFRAENGATRLIPGSHRWEPSRLPKEEECVYAEMPQGSVAIWLGRTFHALSKSVENVPRTGIAVAFTVGWLRQEENQYLAIPLDIVKTLPEKLQQLLGYQTHSTLLGWCEGLDSNLQTREADSDLLDNVSIEEIEADTRKSLS